MMAKAYSYWSKSGRHQKLYDRLYSKLVPDSGEAGSDAGELLRTMSNVYYDIYNNGGYNLLDGGRQSDLDELESLTRTWGIKGQAKTFELIRGYASTDALPGEHCDNCSCGSVDDDQRHFTMDEIKQPLEILVDEVVLKAQELSRRKVPR